MVLLALYPRPFVYPGGVIAFMRQSRRHVVVGKVGIQYGPRARQGVDAKIENSQAQYRSLDPTRSAIILHNYHVLLSSGHKQRLMLVCRSMLTAVSPLQTALCSRTLSGAKRNTCI